MGGFKGMFKKKKKEYNYEDFDTDDEEDLDLIHLLVMQVKNTFSIQVIE
jgi:uncharacterized protein YfkK (UPF0435 family)